MEVLDDARHGRTSVVWFNGGRVFAPQGLGGRDALRANTDLREEIGELAFQHLLAYVHSGSRLRTELPAMLADCPSIIFVDSLDELKASIQILLSQQNTADAV